jgi:hypothetical protein
MIHRYPHHAKTEIIPHDGGELSSAPHESLAAPRSHCITGGIISAGMPPELLAKRLPGTSLPSPPPHHRSRIDYHSRKMYRADRSVRKAAHARQEDARMRTVSRKLEGAMGVPGANSFGPSSATVRAGGVIPCVRVAAPRPQRLAGKLTSCHEDFPYISSPSSAG